MTKRTMHDAHAFREGSNTPQVYTGQKLNQVVFSGRGGRGSVLSTSSGVDSKKERLKKRWKKQKQDRFFCATQLKRKNTSTAMQIRATCKLI